MKHQLALWLWVAFERRGLSGTQVVPCLTMWKIDFVIGTLSICSRCFPYPHAQASPENLIIFYMFSISMKWESTVISRWGWRKRFSNDHFTDEEETHRGTNILTSGQRKEVNPGVPTLSPIIPLATTVQLGGEIHPAAEPAPCACTLWALWELRVWWLWHCSLPLEQTHLHQQCDMQLWQGKTFAYHVRWRLAFTKAWDPALGCR